MTASKKNLKQPDEFNRLSDLKERRFVGYIAEIIFDKELGYLSEIGLERVSLASNSVSAQFNLLRTGAGVGIVHGFALPFEPNLERVPLEVFLLRRLLYLTWKSDDRPVNRLNRFAKDLISKARFEVARLERKA